MTAMTGGNNRELIQLAQKHKLTHENIADATMYSIDSVKGWMTEENSVRHRKMPDRAMKLLEIWMNEKGFKE